MLLAVNAKRVIRTRISPGSSAVSGVCAAGRKPVRRRSPRPTTKSWSVAMSALLAPFGDCRKAGRLPQRVRAPPRLDGGRPRDDRRRAAVLDALVDLEAREAE